MSRSRNEPGEAEQPAQQTQPKGKDAQGKPAKPETIPVPTRGEFFRDLKKVTKTGEATRDMPGDEHES
jgi:hypothetical protein